MLVSTWGTGSCRTLLRSAKIRAIINKLDSFLTLKSRGVTGVVGVTGGVTKDEGGWGWCEDTLLDICIRQCAANIS